MRLLVDGACALKCSGMVGKSKHFINPDMSNKFSCGTVWLFLTGTMKFSMLYSTAALLMVLFFCSSCRPEEELHESAQQQETEQALSLGGKIRNSSRMIMEIRKGLKAHSSAITVSFSYGSDLFADLNKVIEEWMEAAQAETGVPDEGDYIRYQLGGYNYKSTSEQKEDRWFYKVRIEPSYYTFFSEEKEVTAQVRKIRRNFHFWPWTSRAVKAGVIYDYLCKNVRYDKVHRKNPYYHKRSTAYGALVQKTATCQGYCTAMYRLLQEEKIPCRIVTGTAGDEALHAWLIVELDGLWYLLDPTWDAGQEEYRYLLKGTDAFADDGPVRQSGSEKTDVSDKDVQAVENRSGETALIPHLAGSEFLTEEFLRDHPMSKDNYRQPETGKEGE